MFTPDSETHIRVSTFNKNLGKCEFRASAFKTPVLTIHLSRYEVCLRGLCTKRATTEPALNVKPVEF